MMFCAVLRLLLITATLTTVAAPAIAQEHGAPPSKADAAGQHTEQASEEHAEEGAVAIIARLFNFAVLAGVLVYFLRTPTAEYLKTRSEQITQDLVSAAEMRRTATAQIEGIKRRLAELPGELETLKARGAEDIQAEEARIAETSKAERARLLDQTRREIELRLRVARRELTEHAAQLAVSIAEERIKRTITADDQLRLLDQYTTQLQAGAGGSNVS